MNDEVLIDCKRLHPDAVLPSYAMKGDAGLDLSTSSHVIMGPGQKAIVPTGWAISIPKGRVGLIHPRSGLAAKHGVTVLNAPGTIDSAYRGEVKVILINHGFETIGFMPGDRIAQLVVQKFSFGHPREVEELDETVRGEGGLGSTGIRHLKSV